MKHTTPTEYAFIQSLLGAIKEEVDNRIGRVIYFSDGCGGQYKNREPGSR